MAMESILLFLRARSIGFSHKVGALTTLRGSGPSVCLSTARQTHLCEVAALGVGLAHPPVLPTSSELCSSPASSAPLSAPTLPTASHQRACRGSRWPQECRPCARLRDRRRK